MDTPTYTIPDAFERTSREAQNTAALVLPDFEAAVILSTAKAHPGLMKRELVERIMGKLGRPKSEERIFLRYLDSLVGLRYVDRTDFRFYLTRSGTMRLAMLRDGLAGALNQVLMG